MSKLELQLKKSVGIVDKNKRLERLVSILQIENETLRRRIALLQARAEFDVSGDELPALLRPQI